MNKILLCLYILLTSSTAIAGDIYYAKIVKVDKNNILHIVHKKLIRAVTLGYITTPVDGEIFHQDVNDYLSEHLLGKWVRVTELPYGDKAIVKPVLIRKRDLSLINTELLKKGYAIPNTAVSPPPSIYTAAKAAYQNKLGLWSNISEFNKQRNSANKDRIAHIMSDYKVGLIKAKKAGIEPYVGDKKTNKAFKLTCVNYIKQPVFFVTQYAATNQGYSINNKDCPK